MNKDNIRIKIAILDSHVLMCESLSFALNSKKDFKLIYKVFSVNSLYKKFKDSFELPDILILNIAVIDISSINLLDTILTQFPSIKILIIYYSFNTNLFFRVLDYNVSGFIPTTDNMKNLQQVIRKIYNGGRYYSPKIVDLMVNKLKNLKKSLQNDNSEITELDLLYLNLLCQNKNNLQISEILELSSTTILTIRKRLYIKTNTENITGLLLYSIKNKLVELI